MKISNKLSLTALMSYAAAYSAHSSSGNSDLMDTANSTKEFGLVKWQYFFDGYVSSAVTHQVRLRVNYTHAGSYGP
jgi:hypothetical protein